MDPNFYTGSPGRRRQLPQVPVTNEYAAIPNPAISPAIPMQPTPTYSPSRQNLHLSKYTILKVLIETTLTINFQMKCLVLTLLVQRVQFYK